MKKYFLLLCLVMPLLLISCQATPEAPVIVNKNDGKLEEKLEEIVAEEQSVMQETATFHVTEESRTESGTTLKIDADVSIPDATKFPVLRVKPRGFSDEEVRKAVAYLADGSIL